MGYCFVRSVSNLLSKSGITLSYLGYSYVTWTHTIIEYNIYTNQNSCSLLLALIKPIEIYMK